MSGRPGGGNLSVASSDDIVTARSQIRAFGDDMGFGLADVTRIVTASSELMRNIVDYAGEGEVRWKQIEDDGRQGIELVFRDDGPGIHNLDLALQPGESSGRGLGMGLPGTQRLMDDMQIESEAGHGTTITVRKWLPSRTAGGVDEAR